VAVRDVITSAKFGERGSFIEITALFAVTYF